MGRHGRKLGLGDQQEPKATLKTGQKAESTTDSIMAGMGNDENLPVTEKAPTQGGAADGEQYPNWYNYMNCQNWTGVSNWGWKYRCRRKKRGVLANGEIEIRRVKRRRLIMDVKPIKIAIGI